MKPRLEVPHSTKAYLFQIALWDNVSGYNLLRQSLLGSNLRDSLSAETQRRTVSDQAVGFDEDRTDPPGWNPNHTTKLKNV